MHSVAPADPGRTSKSSAAAAGAEEWASRGLESRRVCERGETEHHGWRRHHQQVRGPLFLFHHHAHSDQMSSWVMLVSTMPCHAIAKSCCLAACRAHVVGALLGAQHGEEALPGDWQKKAKRYMDVKQMAHIVIVQRKTFVPFHINRDPAQQPQAGQ